MKMSDLRYPKEGVFFRHPVYSLTVVLSIIWGRTPSMHLKKKVHNNFGDTGAQVTNSNVCDKLVNTANTQTGASTNPKNFNLNKNLKMNLI